MQKMELDAFKKKKEEKKQAILDNNFVHQKSMENLRGVSLDEADEAAMSMKNTLDGLIFERHNEELEYIERALEKIEEARELLKDKPRQTEIFVSLSAYELRHIHMALRLWDYSDTIIDEELDLIHK